MDYSSLFLRLVTSDNLPPVMTCQSFLGDQNEPAFSSSCQIFSGISGILSAKLSATLISAIFTSAAPDPDQSFLRSDLSIFHENFVNLDDSLKLYGLHTATRRQSNSIRVHNLRNRGHLHTEPFL